MGNPAPASRKTTTPNPLYDTNATLAALNCSRWKLWNLCKTDPDFPLPRDIAGKNQWTQQEIEDYKLTRPRRIYAALVAVLAMVSVAAPFLTKLLA